MKSARGGHLLISGLFERGLLCLNPIEHLICLLTEIKEGKSGNKGSAHLSDEEVNKIK